MPQVGSPLAAILDAVNDALAPLGALIFDQAITPERVLRALGRVGAPGTNAPGHGARDDR